MKRRKHFVRIICFVLAVFLCFFEGFAGESIQGDVNGDGKVGTPDLVAVRKLLSGELSEDEYNGDVDGDGRINNRDITKVRKILAGEEDAVVTTVSYKLDISAQTLGKINTPNTYKNIGAEYDGSLQPFSGAWPAAGWNKGVAETLLVMMKCDNYIKIADCVDLSKYSSISITYASDNSFNSFTSELGFFSEPTSYGDTVGGEKNTENLLFSAVLDTPVPSGKTNWHNMRKTSAEISSDYVGPLYLSHYFASGHGIVVTDITFTYKTPQTVVGDSLNNTEGDAVYTVSGNGETITANGITYPNKNNYTNGVTVATDDVGRNLPTTASGSAYSRYDFANKNVGMFYFLWLGNHGNAGPYNIQSLVEQYGVGAVELAGNSSVWGRLGEMHFFAEPLYGYYHSDDEWVIRKHMEELTNADVDFLYFDVTNGHPYLEEATLVMKVISEMINEGFDAPGVVFYCNTNNTNITDGKSMIRYLYDNVYAANLYPEAWFEYEGKPVIIGPKEDYNKLPEEGRNLLTFRETQWPTEAKKKNAWSWMDFTDPAIPNKNSSGKNEAINVSVAQHMGTIAFGDSGIYGYNVTAGGPTVFPTTTALNHGRNWHNGYNDLTPGAYKYGYNFQEQWNTVHNKYPDIPVVLVTGWNEWVAGPQNTSNDPNGRGENGKNIALFVDTATVDYSRDIEMIKGYYFDNYYMQLISNVRQYKGAPPTLIQNMKKRIDVEGSFDQWNSVTTSFRDMSGDSKIRNSAGFGTLHYRNTTPKNNLVSAKVVCDTEYAYFYVECQRDISALSTSSSWMQLFIDADMSSDTGWYGYDFIVNYKAASETKTTLANYTGSNGEYAFEAAENISYSKSGKMMMIKIPLESLGFDDCNDVSFSFKWADSKTNITTMEQMYTDGDQMPHGRLNFVFTNK